MFEEQYEQYLDNPASVPETWRTYFDALQNVACVGWDESHDVAHGPIVESFAQRAKSNGFVPRESSCDLATARKQVYVQSLIGAYRFLGSQWANLDPLKRRERPAIPEARTRVLRLHRSRHGPDVPWRRTCIFGFEQASLREIVKALRDTYWRYDRRRVHVHQRSGTEALVERKA